MNWFDGLENKVSAALGEVSLGTVSAKAVTVSVPSYRYEHDTFQILVEHQRDGFFRLSDAGELRTDLLAEPDNRADLLKAVSCGGFDVSLDATGGLTSLVHPDGDLAVALIGFARALISIPVLFRAIPCITSEPASSTQRPESELAKQTKARLCAVHPKAAPFLRFGIHAAGRNGVDVKVPLVMTTTPSADSIRMAATFLDFSESTPKVTFARFRGINIGYVLAPLTVPKYLVVNGDPKRMGEVSEFFGGSGLQVLKSSDLTEMEKFVGDELQRLRLV
jgi:hypothetical protein